MDRQGLFQNWNAKLAYLFDTNAISEVFRKRPNSQYLSWLKKLPRGEQFTSIAVVAELYAGAYNSGAVNRWLQRVEEEILTSFNVLAFDMECARRYGVIRAYLQSQGQMIGDVDTQIAATALNHSLILVTANERHFRVVPDLQVKTFKPGEPPGDQKTP